MNTTIKTHIAMLALAAGVLLVSACTYTTEADCRAKGGTWKLASAGHVSGAELPGCDATAILQ